MAQNQDFFEDEEQDIRQDDIDMEEPIPEVQESEDEVNSVQFFSKLLDMLETGLTSGTSIPWTSKRIVDADYMNNIIRELRMNIPETVALAIDLLNNQSALNSQVEKRVHRQVSETNIKVQRAMDKAKAQVEQMLRDAHEEARVIEEDARASAKAMVSQSEIVRRAREEADMIISDAHNEANATMRNAQQYAYETLSDVSSQLGEFKKGIDRQLNVFGDQQE